MMTHDEAKRRIAVHTFSIDGFDSLDPDKKQACAFMARWHIDQMTTQRNAIQSAIDTLGVPIKIAPGRAEYFKAGARAAIAVINKALNL